MSILISSEYHFTLLSSLTLSNALHIYTIKNALLGSEAAYLNTLFCFMLTLLLCIIGQYQEALKYFATVMGVHIIQYVIERFGGIFMLTRRKLQ